MNPHWGGESSTASSKKKGKQRRVDHTRPKSPTPERVFGEAMEVDRISMKSASSSNPLIADILDDLDFDQDATVGHPQEIDPQDIQAIGTSGDGQQGQPHKSWVPAQPGREELDKAQAVAGAGQKEVGDASSSYLTDSVFSDDSWIDQTGSLKPEALKALKYWLNDPFFELDILWTKAGFPYSVQDRPKPYICRCFGCEKQDRTFVDMSSLMKHQKNHQSDEAKAYECRICRKAFVLRHYAIRHLKEHFDVRPFGCDVCPSRFKRKEQLMNHLASRKGCQLAWKKWSTASSTSTPQTPSTVSEEFLGSLIKDRRKGPNEVKIASNSSHPLPRTHNPGQDS